MCKYLGISGLNEKRVKGDNDSAIKEHFLFCNHTPDFENFSILSTNNNDFKVTLMESLLINRDHLPLNKRCWHLFLLVIGGFSNTGQLTKGYLTFYKMVVTIMKTTFRKLEPTVINYRKYKNFSNDIFRDTLIEEISRVRINNNDNRFNKFLRICRNTLDRFPPRKKVHQ